MVRSFSPNFFESGSGMCVVFNCPGASVARGESGPPVAMVPLMFFTQLVSGWNAASAGSTPGAHSTM
jgi:hypothetical protein